MNREQPPPNPMDTTEKPRSLADVPSELKARLPDPSLLDIADQRERFNATSELSRMVGHRLANCSFKSYHVTEETSPSRPSQQDVWTQFESFVWDLPARTKLGGGLVLFGRPGCGKDHLAVAAGYVGILQHGYSVQWVHGLKLFELARRLIRVDGDETAFVRDYVRPKILIVSDPIPPKGTPRNTTPTCSCESSIDATAKANHRGLRSTCWTAKKPNANSLRRSSIVSATARSASNATGRATAHQRRQ